MTTEVVDPKQLKRIRGALGMTQQRLAEEAGVSQSLVAKIEAGKVDPTYGSMKSISEALRRKRSEVRRKAADVMSSPVVFVPPGSKVAECISIMKKRGISQVPVIDEGRAVGSVTEAKILEILGEARDPAQVLGRSVRVLMGPPFPSVSPETPIDALFSLFNHVPAVLVASADKVEGVIAKIDLLAAEAGRT